MVHTTKSGVRENGVTKSGVREPGDARDRQAAGEISGVAGGADGYEERVELLYVYRPAAVLGPLTGVAPGSAIVGPGPCEGSGPRSGCQKPFTVYYEGDVYYGATGYEGTGYGAANLRTFVDRAVRAAGRLREEYPTTAKSPVRPCDVQTARN